MDIILIGNGGHSKVIQATIERTEGYNLIGILDQTIEEYYESNSVFYDNITNLEAYKSGASFILAFGNLSVRQQLIDDYGLTDDNFTSIIDSTAIIAPDVSVGTGTVVMPGAVVNPGSTVGKHVIINTNAVVEHDNNIGHFVHISPNATLAGTVTVKEGSHVGSGATIIPNTIVHENAVVGAGSVVTTDIESNAMVVGVPAKIVKRRL